MPRCLPALVGLVAALALAAPAPAQTLPVPATPDLIDRAVQRGEITKATGLLYLARAILRPNTIPQRFVSDTPWDGTMPLRRVREQAPRLSASPARRETLAMLRAPQEPGNPSLNCSTDSAGPLPQYVESEHFFVEYADDASIGGGLTIQDYADSLDGAWEREVVDYGYKAPPILEGTPYDKYNVRVSPLQPGLYGYVTSFGTYAGDVGDNPDSSWVEDDALATCMVLNSDYATGFDQLTVGTPQQRLDATTAHEFLHSIQFGLGALDGETFEPDLHFSEGHATWMEDEVYDGADDNHNYLYPTFEDGMGEHEDGDVYSYWLTWRGITERFGTGIVGTPEDIIQRFWEITSREEAHSMAAMHLALEPLDLGLGTAYHDYAVASRFMKACGGEYVLPDCFEEADVYAEVAEGRPEAHGAIAEIGGEYAGTEEEPAQVEDNLALNWVDLPQTTLPLAVTVEGLDAGHALRVSVICDTGTTIRRTEPASVSGADEVTTRFETEGCESRPSAVITNQTRVGGANPAESTFARYAVRVEEAPPPPPDPVVDPPPGDEQPADELPPPPPGPEPTPFVPPGPTPPACDAGTRLRTASVSPRGRGLAFDFAPREGAAVTVDVFQVARGRRIGSRLVARFRDRSGSFTWNGVSNRGGRRVRDGYLFVRFRAADTTGADLRRVALRRKRGRWSLRPSFALADSCATLSAYKLLRPVFGGPGGRSIGVSYRLGSAASVTLEVLEDGVVVRRFRQGLQQPGPVHRIRVGAKRFVRGNVTFRLRLERDGRTETAELVARRL